MSFYNGPSGAGQQPQRKLMQYVEEEEDDEDESAAAAGQRGAAASWASLNGAGQQAVGAGGWSGNNGSSEDAIRQHQRRLQRDAEQHFPLSAASSSDAILGATGASGRGRSDGTGGGYSKDDSLLGGGGDGSSGSKCGSPLSNRCKLGLTVAFGTSLILGVLVVFVVVLNEHLGHPTPASGDLNKNVFHMQLLGQSVLRYDIRQGQRLHTLATLQTLHDHSTLCAHVAVCVCVVSLVCLFVPSFPLPCFVRCCVCSQIKILLSQRRWSRVGCLRGFLS